MLLATELKRVFLFKDKGQEIKLTDPNPQWSAETVMNFYANTYPVLTTATIDGPNIMEDMVKYEFKSAIGTKG